MSTRARQQSPPRSVDIYESDPEAWPYEFRPAEGTETVVNGHELAVESTDGETYAGAYPRALMANGRNRPDQPFGVGVDQTGALASVDYDAAFRHILATGETGSGKSTFGLRNHLVQLAERGDGFMSIDAGGDDTIGFTRVCPDHRLDDIVYVDPSSKYRDRVTGFNLLETFHEPGDEGFADEVGGILSAILPAIDAEEFVRIKGVLENVVRALCEANHQQDDHRFCPLDIYYILAGAENREAYAEFVRETPVSRFYERYADEIAQLDDDKMEPVVRRFQRFAEDEQVRMLMAQRENALSFREVVEENKIVLVRADVENDDVQDLLTAIPTRKIWSYVGARPSPEEQRIRAAARGADPDAIDASVEPFHLVIDEFHAVCTPEMNIGEMLAMARKKKLGIVLLTQQLHQLPDGIREDVQSNAVTRLAFDPGSLRKEQRAVLGAFDSLERGDLDLDDYHAWITTPGNDPPYVASMFAPAPPRRDAAAANAVIEAALDRHGADRLSEDEIFAQMPDLNGVSPPTPDGAGGEGGEDTDVQHALCKAIYDESLVLDAEDGLVAADAVLPRFERYTGRDWHSTNLWNHIERTPEIEDPDGEHVRVTDEGVADILATGSSAPSGKGKHRKLLKDAYPLLFDLGLEVELPTQDSDVDVDGIGRVRESGRLADRPTLDALTGGGDVTIEAERSTGYSKGGQTCRNLAKAIAREQKCLFLAREAVAPSVHHTLTDPPHVSDELVSCLPTDWRFYNLGDLHIYNEQMRRPGDAEYTLWYRDPGTGEYVLADSNGDEHARFPDADAIFEAADRYPDVPEGGGKPVKMPFVPERAFAREPTREDWEILVVPEDDGELRLVQKGDIVPLKDIVPDADEDGPSFTRLEP